jgi:hypothetical protein
MEADEISTAVRAARDHVDLHNKRSSQSEERTLFKLITLTLSSL